MEIYYSDAVKGFFDSEVNAEIPPDALEISEEKYFELLNGQSSGKEVGLGADGLPALVDAPAPTAEVLKERAEIFKASYLAQAKEAISPLQDAADLDVATDEEVRLLTAWKTFRLLISRIDTAAPDIDWPQIPV